MTVPILHMPCYDKNTHVHDLFDTELHELGRVGSRFNWQSEDQCQRTNSKWVFVFIPHKNPTLKS